MNRAKRETKMTGAYRLGKDCVVNSEKNVVLVKRRDMDGRILGVSRIPVTSGVLQTLKSNFCEFRTVGLREQIREPFYVQTKRVSKSA